MAAYCRRNINDRAHSSHDDFTTPERVTSRKCSSAFFSNGRGSGATYLRTIRKSRSLQTKIDFLRPRRQRAELFRLRLNSGAYIFFRPTCSRCIIVITRRGRLLRRGERRFFFLKNFSRKLRKMFSTTSARKHGD